MSWDKEFNSGDYDRHAIESILLHGWADESWHNDACPSFTFGPNLEFEYATYPEFRIWVETRDSDLREGMAHQFCFTQHGINEGEYDTVFQTNNFDELRPYLTIEGLVEKGVIS